MTTPPSSADIEPPFIGEPSTPHRLLTLSFRTLRALSDRTGTTAALPALSASTRPPRAITRRLDVNCTEFQNIPVWTLKSPAAGTGKCIVALHSGGYAYQTNIGEWWTYAVMSRHTGATVVVPIYPLIPTGTAATVVPVMAELIARQIQIHGADSVGVMGSSAGGGLALAAVQELVHRHLPTPVGLVLISPWLDVSLSDPRSTKIDDPILDVSALREFGRQWAADLSTTDPRASPLYGSLAGLPRTLVYSGSLDALAPDSLRLQQLAIAQEADMAFEFLRGGLHGYVGFPLLPETSAARPDIYRCLVGHGCTPDFYSADPR